MVDSPLEHYTNCIFNGIKFDAMSVDLPTLIHAIDAAGNLKLYGTGDFGNEETAPQVYAQATLTAIRLVKNKKNELTPAQHQEFSGILSGALIYIVDKSIRLQANEELFDFCLPEDQMGMLQEISDRILDDYNRLPDDSARAEFLEEDVPTILQRILPPKPDGARYTNADLLSQQIEIHYVPPKNGALPASPFAQFKCYLVPKSPPDAPNDLDM